MATERAIAVMRAEAMGRIEKSASALSKTLEGVSELPSLASIRGYGDIELAHAKQLEAVAEVLASVVEASGKALGDSQDMANSIIKEHQDRIAELELQLADAQTQLLALKKNEPAVPADDVAKPKGK